ncbi:MAG: GNAT family N-acetyltransferase [Verrucomicrobiota bacterium]|nr:GNAT family N-acetyltransferase [Verrucomicrobiota bacterium]
MTESLQPGQYPAQYESSATFPGRLKAYVRPIRPDDDGRLSALFASHSVETIYQRYFTHLKQIPTELLKKFVSVDYVNDMALVAFRKINGEERFIAVGRYFKNPTTQFAEVAVTIDDPYQKKGIGTFLLEKLKQIALENGIKGFTASMLATNQGMIHLFSHVLGKHEARYADGLYYVRKQFAPDKRKVPPVKTTKN